jgi:hypothetical protein
MGWLVHSHIHDNVLMAFNWATGAGAFVRSSGMVVWENVIIERNLVVLNTTDGSYGQGGGLYTDSVTLGTDSLTLRGCTIRDNEVLLGSAEASGTAWLYGGGVYSDRQLALLDCNVTSNRVTALPTLAMTINAEGGGVYQKWNGAIAGLNITRATLRANTVTVGGSCSATSVARGGGESIDA